MTPIDKAGIYDITSEQYHSQACCVGPSISSSGLRKISRECPARYWATSDLNPAGRQAADKDAFAFGRAAHALVLGEPEFDKHFVVSPYDTFRTKDAQQWREEQTRTVLRNEEMAVVREMAAAQQATWGVRKAFTAGRPEQSVIWCDDETGVWLKSRPDWLPDKPGLRFIVEYKTCHTIEPKRLSEDVFKYGYEMQAAMLIDGVQQVLGVQPLGVAHVVQEKDYPYLCDLRMFTKEQVEFGRWQYRRALRTFAECLNTGKWPPYTEGAQFFDTPYWVTKAMENANVLYADA